MGRQFRRRGLLRAGGTALVAATGVAGCDALSTNPAGEKEGGAKAGSDSGKQDRVKESPVLSKRVDAGDLPALKDRLPEEPLVVKPLDEPGLYGGTIRRGETSMQSPRNLYFLARFSLAEWGLREVEPVPGLAAKWEIGDGGRTYRFSLRKGVKWSDGKPFTADDLMFYYDAVLKNEKLTAVAPSWLRTGDKPATISKVDDATVEFRFADPDALLVRSLSFAPHGMAILTPAHYLKQFHPDYVSESELKSMAKDAQLDSWMDLYNQQNSMWLNPDRPTLGAWMVTKPSTGAQNRSVLERNPYYWKVDPEGRQLPYVDQVVVAGVDAATATLQAAHGDIDLQSTYISISNMPVLAKNRKKAGYDVLNWGTGSGPYLYTNQCHADPVMRELMQNIDFRAGLSHAIDRDEMNQLFYGGLGSTMQPVCLPEDPYHVKGSGDTFVKHDTTEANRRLDAAGLDGRAKDGFRLRPDGKPLHLTISTFPFETGVSSVDAYELVKKYWQKVGIKTTVDNMDGSLWSERMHANKFDIGGYDMGRYMWDINALWYVPISPSTYWAPMFGLWYSTEGQDGEKPSEELLHLQQTYDDMKTAPDDATRTKLGKEIQKAHDENVWVIGTVTAPFQPVVVNADLINLKDKAVNDYRTGYTQLTWPEQVAYQHPEDNA